MFDVDEFLASCTVCLTEPEPRLAVRDLLTRTVSRASEVADALPPDRAGITLLHNAPDLTVIKVVWAPGMRLYPHDHRMWAAISIYGGYEDNAFYRRRPEGDGRLVESGGKRLAPGDVTLLGADTVHAVSNPMTSPTGAIHVYGGDFVNQPRSQWPTDDAVEQAYDHRAVMEVFAAANREWHAA
jgi:predicted metal-dependent enzyme (double-stranded beta helix superfamily)